ncbi:MAG: DUF6444 domain-containing protein, partial [Pseudonocardiaceae bacterium]
MSRDELIVVVHRQAGRITAQDQQITAQAGQLAELRQANEALAAKLARLEHLLSRNSGNSSSPPSKDDDPGRTPPPDKGRGGGAKRSRGKQPGAPGSHLAWTDTPDDRQDRFPEGCCGCGADLAGARDLGVVDRYQQHEIPQSALVRRNLCAVAPKYHGSGEGGGWRCSRWWSVLGRWWLVCLGTPPDGGRWRSGGGS